MAAELVYLPGLAYRVRLLRNLRILKLPGILPELIIRKPKIGHIKIHVIQRLQFRRKCLVIPCRDFRDLVICKPERLDLRIGKICRPNRRDLGYAELFGGLKSGMAGNQNPVPVYDHGNLKTEFPNTGRDRVYGGSVVPGIVSVWDDVVNVQVLYFHGVILQETAGVPPGGGP